MHTLMHTLMHTPMQRLTLCKGNVRTLPYVLIYLYNDRALAWRPAPRGPAHRGQPRGPRGGEERILSTG